MNEIKRDLSIHMQKLNIKIKYLQVQLDNYNDLKNVNRCATIFDENYWKTKAEKEKAEIALEYTKALIKLNS